MEDPSNSVNKYFPNNNQYEIMHEETSKVQERPMDFNVTEYKKFTDTISDLV